MDRLRLGLCRVIFATWQVKDRLEHPDATEGFILVRMRVPLLVTVCLSTLRDILFLAARFVGQPTAILLSTAVIGCHHRQRLRRAIHGWSVVPGTCECRCLRENAVHTIVWRRQPREGRIMPRYAL